MKTRLPGIDLLRTSAIFIMIIANASPYLVKGSISYEFRLFCSLAAPVFIFLSGFVLSVTIKAGEKNWAKWRNAGYLIATGAFILFILVAPFIAYFGLEMKNKSKETKQITVTIEVEKK